MEGWWKVIEGWRGSRLLVEGSDTKMFEDVPKRVKIRIVGGG